MQQARGKKDDGKASRCKKLYQTPAGPFKGKKGERFKNCVKYQQCMGKSKDAATKICASIAHKKYGGLNPDDVE